MMEDTRNEELAGLRAVQPIRIGARTTVGELVTGLQGCAFGAGRLARAVAIYEAMLTEETTKFLGIAGALVPAGMRSVLADLIRDRYVDVVVTTGANLVHDIIEALGSHHYLREIDQISVCGVPEDVWLRRHNVDRIYDLVVHDEAFAKLEAFLHGIFERLDERRYTIRELLTAIGEHISDRNSILRCAVESNVPVFCPALADSMIGLHAWIYMQSRRLEVDVFADMRELIEHFSVANRTGAIILGGGVPKNFIFQAALVAPRPEGREGLDYAIQLTTHTPEDGSLSGATLEEARSWGKISGGAKTVTVHTDATIALPIIVAALRERMAQRTVR